MKHLTPPRYVPPAHSGILDGAFWRDTAMSPPRMRRFDGYAGEWVTDDEYEYRVSKREKDSENEQRK